jgi:hypothetical protein
MSSCPFPSLCGLLTRAQIYTNIVGSCAPSGCPITQQNYIDFIYGAMSAANVTQWPRCASSLSVLSFHLPFPFPKFHFAFRIHLRMHEPLLTMDVVPSTT